ncbi:MAG: acetate--CoA ligase family protein [Rhodospirillaceae bacterium]
MARPIVAAARGRGPATKNPAETAFRPADHLFRPKSIAILGASETGGSGWPRNIYQNLEFAGFPAEVYLINPNRTELWGRPVYPSFAALPAPADLALAIVPAEAMAGALEDGARHGLKAALVFAARFGEGGDSVGAERAAALGRLSADYGLRLCGPNCMGSLSLAENLLLYPAARVRGLPKGPVGVVFQSGGTFQYWLAQGAVRGLGYSYAVSSGNELDLDLADYVNFLVEDDATRVIACMVEGVRRGPAFMAAAAKALERGKPIVLVKIGRSEGGRASTQSHTGALAGDDAVFDAMCRQAGVIRCKSLDDMIDTCLAFQAGRLPAGGRVAMAGYSGGMKGLFLDHGAEEGLEIAKLEPATLAALRPLIDAGVSPDNPLDTGAGVARRPKVFAEICRIVAADPNVDMLSMQGQLPIDAGDGGSPEDFAEVLNATAKPVVAHVRTAQNTSDHGRAFQAACGVPFLYGLPQTARALKALADYAAARRRGVAPLPTAGAPPAGADAASVERALAAAGVTPPNGAFAATAAEAGAAAVRIGFPVALKLVSPEATHKTEVGGVALGLATADAVAAEAAAMAARLAAIRPGATVAGFLVQEMVSGAEMIVGVREDPQFGPFCVVGLGGVFVEVMKDTAIRLLPGGVDDARAMIDALRGRALLGAFRGAPPRDVEALARAVAGVCRVFLDHRPLLTDLEVNPIIVLEQGRGVRAVDIRPVWR